MNPAGFQKREEALQAPRTTDSEDRPHDRREIACRLHHQVGRSGCRERRRQPPLPRPGSPCLGSVKYRFHWGIVDRENLTEHQAAKLADLLRSNLKSVKAHRLSEPFQRCWDHAGPTAVGKFLDSWSTEAMRSRLEPMNKVARSLRRHRAAGPAAR